MDVYFRSWRVSRDVYSREPGGNPGRRSGDSSGAAGGLVTGLKQARRQLNRDRSRHPPRKLTAKEAAAAGVVSPETEATSG